MKIEFCRGEMRTQARWKNAKIVREADPTCLSIASCSLERQAISDERTISRILIENKRLSIDQFNYSSSTFLTPPPSLQLFFYFESFLQIQLKLLLFFFQNVQLWKFVYSY